MAREEDPELRLLAFIRHHVTFFAAHMDEMKVLAHEEGQLSGTMRAQVRRRKREYVSLLNELLRAAGADADDRQIAAYALFGMMNWIYTWYHPGGLVAPARLGEEVGHLFLHGFRRSATPAAALATASSGGFPS